MRRSRHHALLSVPAAPARRPVGLRCTLMLGLALATMCASGPVSAEQAAGEPHSAETVPAHSPVEPVTDPRPAEEESPAAAAVRHAAEDASGSSSLSATADTSADALDHDSGMGVQAGTAAAPAAADTDSPAPDAAPAPAAMPAAAPPAASAEPRAHSAAPRRSLLPLVQPLWSELSESQRQTLAPLELQWNTLTRDEKRPWLTLAARLPKMDPKSRARAEKRIREWAALTPEQRRLARNNYRLAKKLPKEQRVATWEQYQQMTPEQQAVLRQAGWTSNTAAGHAGAPTGLAKEAAQPLWRRLLKWIWDPEQEKPDANGKPADGAAK